MSDHTCLFIIYNGHLAFGFFSPFGCCESCCCENGCSMNSKYLFSSIFIFQNLGRYTQGDTPHAQLPTLGYLLHESSGLFTLKSLDLLT